MNGNRQELVDLQYNVAPAVESPVYQAITDVELAILFAIVFS